MAPAARETFLLKTPGGHDVVAEMDYEHFELRRAKVVHGFTGVIKQLDTQTSEILARALRAKQIYEHALEETRAVEKTLQGFGEAVLALGKSHPAVEPYWQEIAQHQTIASDMNAQAYHFHRHAMKAIDKIAGD